MLWEIKKTWQELSLENNINSIKYAGNTAVIACNEKDQHLVDSVFVNNEELESESNLKKKKTMGISNK